MAEYTKELEFAKDIAKQAGGIMLQHFCQSSAGTTWKDDQTELTVADTAINALVINEVKKNFPNHGVLGEEDSFDTDAEILWVCDPIDGTFPYSHGIPVSSFNLALTIKGEVVVAVLYDPFLSRLYHASKGFGSYLNDQKVVLRDREKGRYGLSVEIWGNNQGSVFSERKAEFEIKMALDTHDYILLYHCSVAYTAALVATGELDGVLFSGANPWDAAAASLIIQEAGGVFTDLFGNEQKYNGKTKGFIAAAPNQYDKIRTIVDPVIKQQKLR